MKHFSRWCLILLPLLAALLNACSGDDGKTVGPPPAPVHVQSVARADVPRLLHVVGNVKASATVGVKPRVTGEIQEVHFKEGQDVRAGESLISIDPRPFEAALREKRGELRLCRRIQSDIPRVSQQCQQAQTERQENLKNKEEHEHEYQR